MAVFKASKKASQASETPQAGKVPKPAKAPKASKPAKPSKASAVSGPFGAAVADIGAKRYPYALLMAVVSWLIVAVTLFVSQVGAPQTTIDNASEAQVTGMSGQIAPTAQDQWFVPLLPWVGILVVIAAVALFVGVGWARLALVVIGILTTVALAQAAEQIQAVVVAVFTVVGAVLSLVLSSHRYLNGTASEPSMSADTSVRDEGSAADQTTSGGAIS